MGREEDGTERDLVSSVQGLRCKFHLAFSDRKKMDSFSLFCNQLETQPDFPFAWNDIHPPCSLLRGRLVMNQDLAYLSLLKWCFLCFAPITLASQKEPETKLKPKLPARKNSFNIWDKVIAILISHLNRIMGRGYEQNVKIHSSSLLIN